MVDSINFIIRGIKLEHLKKEFINMCRLNAFYNLKEKNVYLQLGYEFEYKDIKFKYYVHLSTLIIITNTHTIINKRDIKLNDKIEYKNKLEKILKEVIYNLDNVKLELYRIDYYVDLKLDEKIDKYLLLLNKYNKNKFQYMKKNNEYDTSVYLKTKQGKRNINIYKRYDKTKNDNDNGILRLEVQNKKRMINGELEKYGISKDLDNYWTTYAMEDYFFKVIEGYCYTGSHYKRKIANKIIDKSEFTENKKAKLKEFLLDVEKYGLDVLAKSEKYNNCKISSRIRDLQILNINPIPIPNELEYDELESLLNIAKRIATEEYFRE